MYGEHNKEEEAFDEHFLGRCVAKAFCSDASELARLVAAVDRTKPQMHARTPSPPPTSTDDQRRAWLVSTLFGLSNAELAALKQEVGSGDPTGPDGPRPRIPTSQSPHS